MNKQEILSKLNKLQDIIKALGKIQVESLQQVDNNLIEYPDGVYCAWAGIYFANTDEAIELLKDHDGAFEAAVRGFIDFELRPYIENSYNGAMDLLDIDDFSDIEELREFILDYDEIFDYRDDFSTFEQKLDDFFEEYDMLNEEIEETQETTKKLIKI